MEEWLKDSIGFKIKFTVLEISKGKSMQFDERFGFLLSSI